MEKKKLINIEKFIILIAVLGMFITSYLTYTHYIETKDVFCEALGGGCEVVSKAVFSEIDGILEWWGFYVNFPLPVSIIGFLGFLISIFFSYNLLNCLKNNYKKIYMWDLKKFNYFFVFINSIGLIFSIYLTYLEFIILETFCIYCDISKMLFFFIFILSVINIYYLKKIEKNRKK